MRVLLSFLLLAILFACKNNKDQKLTAYKSGKVAKDTLVIPLTPMDSSTARAMIAHYKDSSIDGNRAKLLWSTFNFEKLKAILGKPGINVKIFAAAYLNNYPDVGKRNMPTLIMQVRMESSSEITFSYYYSEETVCCPPPPNCFEVSYLESN